MMKDKRGQRRRWLYGAERTKAIIPQFEIKRAPRNDPLLRPGECRLEAGQVLVREFNSTDDLEGFYIDLRGDPMAGMQRFLVWLSVEMAHRYRAGIIMGLKIARRV